EVQIELDTDDAVQSMENKPPDLAILDVMFPENASAGFELARFMRHESEKLKDVPILMLTAINTKFPLGFGPKDIDDCWLPVTDFLEKPVDFDVLRDKVAKLLHANSTAD
ncbi:MAG: response regulator, partial [Planctomycetota bacterium]